MKKSRFNLHLFAKYIISYAIIIILLSYVYYQIYGMLSDSTVMDSYDFLCRGVEELNDQMDDMYSIATVVGEEQVFSELKRLKDPIELIDYYKLLEARKVLNEFYNLYGVSCNVVFKNNSCVVSNQIVVPNSRSKYSTHSIYEDMSVEELSEKIFADTRVMVYLGEQTARYTEETTEVFSMAIKLPVNFNVRYDSAIVFLFDKEKLIEELIGKDADDGIFLYVTDEDGIILLDHHFNKNPLSLTENAIGEYLEIEGEKFFILSEKVDYGNLRVIVGIPERIFVEQLAPVKNTIIVFMILSILLAIIFATQRVAGIKKIINMFFREKHLNKEVKNEYRYIEDSVKVLFREHRQFQEDVDRMEALVRTSLIEKALLYGVYDPIERSKIENFLGKEMEFYCVVCMKLDCESRQETLKLSVWMKDLIVGEFSAIYVSSGLNEMVFLIPLSVESSTDMRGVLDFLKIQVNGYHALLVSVSGIGTGIENIHICYQQAKNRMRQIFAPTERFIYSDEKRESVASMLVNTNLDAKLQGFVFSGQTNEVKKMFEKLKLDMSRQMFEDEQEIMQLFFDLRSPLKNVYDSIVKEESEKNLPRYKTTDSVSQMLDKLERFAIYLCEHVQERKQSKLEAMKNNLVQYLQENYEDSNLCVATVAERFGISERYVFDILKDRTGKSFNEYLEKIRMEKIKEYLENTDIPVNKIGFMVGFNTTDAFYKAFKRVNGIAPGKWRENAKNLRTGKENGYRKTEKI